MLRPTTSASTNAAALLQHLETAGFEQAPRHLGTSADGRDILTYIDGVAGLPPYPGSLRSDEALISVASTIRAFHDAADGFVPPEPWNPALLSTAGPTSIDCIGHGDLTPWNMIFHDSQVAAIIDWDTASPSSRAWDLSYAAYQFVPLHPSETLPFWGWTKEPDRRRRLRLIVDAYDDHNITVGDLLDLMMIRLLSFAAHMEHQIRCDNPAFNVHRDEKHADGSRRSAAFILEHRDSLLKP